MNFLRPACIALLTLAIAAVLAAGESTPAYAATFTVNSTADAVDVSPGDGACATAAGDCTLRAAIQEANALAGPNTVALPAGTYTLSIPGTNEDAAATGDLDVTEDLILTGAGATTTIIDGNHLDRVLNIRISVTARVSGVKIENGEVGSQAFQGAGIGNFGDLTLTDSIVTGNAAVEAGGIFNLFGTLQMNNVTVSDNTATLNVGGISNQGNAILTNVSVSGNEAASFGGGIENGGSLNLTDSAVSSNTALLGGGILNAGTLAVAASTIKGNNAVDVGGGIFNFNVPLTITRSIISGNGAGDLGGGIANEGGSLALVNSTVSGNIANEGAGIHNTGSAVLANGTVSSNVGSLQGGGIFNDGSVTLKNTIVANNNGGDCANLPVTSDGHNLDSDGSCALGGPGDISSTDPQLAPLAHNGGPTLTHALLAGSPAIDAGDNDDCPPTDQRGLARPTGSGCDIGAYEVGSLPVGGIVELPVAIDSATDAAASSAARAYAAPIAGVGVAVLIALAAGGWHASRRWLR